MGRIVYTPTPYAAVNSSWRAEPFKVTSTRLFDGRITGHTT